MPEMSGRELAERLRERPGDEGAVHVRLHGRPAFGEGEFPAGAPFVQKPVLPDVLREQLRVALDR